MKQKLKELTPEQIRANPDNPRAFFRQEEMESLLDSIKNHGIQVPITVYEEGNKYILIDGERRWRCSKKLNLKKIPAIVQPKPSRLENLILMSNIHALREQWDYFTIAQNLKKIKELFKKENNQTPNEVELSQITGLSRGQIRRCQLLLDLPDEHQNRLRKELELPKAQQRLSEDFFIEMESSLKTILKRFPEFDEDIKGVRKTLIRKYEEGTIGAVTDFRQMSKIATSHQNLGVDKSIAYSALKKIFRDGNRKGIKEAYDETLAEHYEEKSAKKYTSELVSFLKKNLKHKKWQPSDEELNQKLQELFDLLKTFVKS